MLGLIDKSQQDNIWARDGHICRRCGESIDRRLNTKGAFFANGGIVITTRLPAMGVVHHINRIRLINDESNLILLCSKCHRKKHGIARRVENMKKGLKSKMPTKEEIEDTLKYVNFDYREI
jgi:5-methylcytosine-specific restriction endonuclease McrA